MNKTRFAILTSIALTAIFLLPFCNLMYKCGCTFPLAGGAEACNIHNASGPHCPWCVDRNLPAMSLPFLAMFFGQVLTIGFVRRKGATSFYVLLGAGLVSFVMIGVLFAWLYKVMDGYPDFIF